MEDVTSSQHDTARNFGSLLALCACGAAALAALLAGAPEYLKEALILVDRDRSVHYLAPAQIRVLQSGLWVGCLGLLALAAMIVTFRGVVSRWISTLLADLAVFMDWLSTELRIIDRSSWIALLAITLVGTAIRLTLMDHPIRFDEADSFLCCVTTDWFNLWTDYTQPNNHIFYNFLAHGSVLLFGETAAAARLPALLAGVALIPAAFYVGRMYFGEATGVVAAAIVSGLPALIDYSSNARAYTLVAFLFLMSLLVTGCLQQKRSICGWCVVAVLITAGLFAVPTMLYAFGTVLLMPLLSADPHRRRATFYESLAVLFICGVASILLYTPPAMRGTWSAILSNQYVVPMTWERAIDRLVLELDLSWAAGIGLIPWPVLLALAVGVVAGIWRPAGWRLLVSMVVPIIVLCTIGRVMPPIRVWLYLLPLIAILAAAGLTHLFTRGPLSSVSRFVPWVAVAGSVLLAVQVSVARVSEPAFEQRFYGQVRDITGDLSGQLTASSVVVAPVPLIHPVLYELRQAGYRDDMAVDPRYIRRTQILTERETIWMVKAHADKTTRRWQLSLGQHNLSNEALAEFTTPMLVKSTEFLELWRADRF